MDQFKELLTRGVDKIYPSLDELQKLLETNKKLTIYQGFDPTGVKLHIGHLVGLNKLTQWQRLGHKVIFVIGDGTGQAGDPSGKTSARQGFLTQEELKNNAIDYVKQAEKIIDFKGENPVEIRFNGDWLNKLTLVELLDIMGHFSLQQLLERDLFQERMRNNSPINLREFIYPILQAYDSVAMDVDLELGGSDQTFNMLAGRNLMKSMKEKNKFVMTTPLLEDSSGKKIGKTEGNVIALDDNPADLYRKVMALGDEVIIKGLECLTRLPMEEIRKVEEKLKNGENPRDFKKKLAYEITKDLNSKAEAEEAEKIFEGIIEGNILTVEISLDSLASVSTSAVESNLVPSISEAKRKFEEGAIKINDKLPSSLKDPVLPGSVISIGKRKIRVEKKENG